MKKHLFTIILLFLGINIQAEAVLPLTINFDELTFKDNKIALSGKLLGKFDVKTKDINVSSKEKTTVYEVTIFDDGGAAVAKLDLQVIDKSKKKSFTIADATLKTLRDNVNHNPSNFINYEDASYDEDSEVPQFDNVVRYLLSYNYF